MMNLRFEKLAKYLAFGLEVPGTILGGVVLGYLADAKLSKRTMDLGGEIRICNGRFCNIVTSTLLMVRGRSHKSD